MKSLACILLALCTAATWCTGTAAQDAPARNAEVFHFEYGGAAGEPGFWWARRADEATLQFTNWTRVNASARPEGVTGSRPGGTESLDRAFFIGNTIANLRGLDPTFGTRTLALQDSGTPSTPPRAVTPPLEIINVADALARLAPRNIGDYMPQLSGTQRGESPPPEPVDLPEDAWLLKQDGTIIRPLRRTPVAEGQKYCAAGRCEQGYVYGFPQSAAIDAVAVAFSKSGVVATRRLDSLAGLQQ
jgi:hypothetical protein